MPLHKPSQLLEGAACPACLEHSPLSLQVQKQAGKREVNIFQRSFRLGLACAAQGWVNPHQALCSASCYGAKQQRVRHIQILRSPSCKKHHHRCSPAYLREEYCACPHCSSSQQASSAMRSGCDWQPAFCAIIASPAERAMPLLSHESEGRSSHLFSLPPASVASP